MATDLRWITSRPADSIRHHLTMVSVPTRIPAGERRLWIVIASGPPSRSAGPQCLLRLGCRPISSHRWHGRRPSHRRMRLARDRRLVDCWSPIRLTISLPCVRSSHRAHRACVRRAGDRSTRRASWAAYSGAIAAGDEFFDARSMRLSSVSTRECTLDPDRAVRVNLFSNTAPQESRLDDESVKVPHTLSCPESTSRELCWHACLGFRQSQVHQPQSSDVTLWASFPTATRWCSSTDRIRRDR